MGRKYPRAGYGGRFGWWLMLKESKPYNSYGNGSAMRVSAAGWLYDSLERTREVARATAEVTRNHPEAITAFLEGEDFENVIRLAVSLGGDCDTLTAMAGSIAEAYYGISGLIKMVGVSRLPDEFLAVLDWFEEECDKMGIDEK